MLRGRFDQIFVVAMVKKKQKNKAKKNKTSFVHFISLSSVQKTIDESSLVRNVVTFYGIR